MEVNGVKFMGRVVKGVAPQDLKPMADEGKKARAPASWPRRRVGGWQGRGRCRRRRRLRSRNTTPSISCAWARRPRRQRAAAAGPTWRRPAARMGRRRKRRSRRSARRWAGGRLARSSGHWHGLRARRVLMLLRFCGTLVLCSVRPIVSPGRAGGAANQWASGFRCRPAGRGGHGRGIVRRTKEPMVRQM